MNPLATSLANSPELFPHALDLRRDVVTLLRLSRADYQNASFLDDRIARPGRDLAWQQLARAVEEAGLGETCHFIFHIGHAGSTLLSRLLGKHPALFSLREPQILRMIAQMPDATRRETYLPACIKLWSRTFNPGARALVKTTSFVSEIAAQLLGRAYSPKALLIGVSPEIYLATIFGGANSPVEARMLAPLRLARLQKRVGGNWRLGDLSEGEVAALGWACEASALVEAAELAGTRVRVLDFERFLAEPNSSLEPVFRHFNAAADAREIAAILSGPEMMTYSKAPEFSYDLQLRRSVLDQGRRLYADEIHRGLLWLDRAAREHQSIGRAFALFNEWSG
jgi:hypothetical protein